MIIADYLQVWQGFTHANEMYKGREGPCRLTARQKPSTAGRGRATIVGKTQ